MRRAIVVGGAAILGFSTAGTSASSSSGSATPAENHSHEQRKRNHHQDEAAGKLTAEEFPEFEAPEYKRDFARPVVSALDLGDLDGEEEEDYLDDDESGAHIGPGGHKLRRGAEETTASVIVDEAARVHQEGKPLSLMEIERKEAIAAMKEKAPSEQSYLEQYNCHADGEFECVPDPEDCLDEWNCHDPDNCKQLCRVHPPKLIPRRKEGLGKNADSAHDAAAASASSLLEAKQPVISNPSPCPRMTGFERSNVMQYGDDDYYQHGAVRLAMCVPGTYNEAGENPTRMFCTDGLWSSSPTQGVASTLSELQCMKFCPESLYLTNVEHTTAGFQWSENATGRVYDSMRMLQCEDGWMTTGTGDTARQEFHCDEHGHWRDLNGNPEIIVQCVRELVPASESEDADADSAAQLADAGER